MKVGGNLRGISPNDEVGHHIEKILFEKFYDGALKALITNFFLSFIPQSGVLRQPNVTHTRTSKNPTKPKIIQILV